MNPENSARTTQFIWAVIILCIVAVGAMLTIAIFKPGDTSTGTLILGIVGPVIAAFLAAAIQGVHLSVNSRLTELIDVTAKASHAEGKLEGQSAGIVVPASHLSDR